MLLAFRRSLAVVALILVSPCLHGQENWDSSFKLVGAQMIGASEAHLGSNTNWAFALEGSYPIFPKGTLVFEGGYRTLLKSTSTLTDPATALVVESDDYWSKGIYGSILYRHTKFQDALEGFFLQGGLRYNILTSSQEQTRMGAGSGGADLKMQKTGIRISNIGPIVGAGYRFSEKLSLEFNISLVKGQSADAIPMHKTSNLMELALGVHL